MCMTCDENPCLNNCPENIGKALHKCGDCLEGIYNGDKYIVVDNCCYHTDCVEEMPFNKQLQLFGCDVHLA